MTIILGNMDEKETIIKVTTILEGLVIEVKSLSSKIDNLKDGHVQETNTEIALLKARVNEIEDQRKTEKERQFILTTAVITEGLAIIGMIIGHFITKGNG